MLTILTITPVTGVLPNGSGTGNQYTRSVDVFAFGLCVLELATTKKLDHTAQQNWAEVVELVQDLETKAFISRSCSNRSVPWN